MSAAVQPCSQLLLLLVALPLLCLYKRYALILQEEESGAVTPSSNGSASPTAVAVPAASPNLPQGWFEALDPTYNHPYW